MVVFAAVAVAFDVVGYYVGWGLPQAIASTLLSVIFTASVIIGARTGLLNPAFFETLGWPEGTAIVTWLIVGIIVLLGLGSVTSAFKRIQPSTQK